MIDLRRHRLSNGLTLLHHRDTLTRMVAVNVLYDTGSIDERPGRTGLAHLYEHLMFTGSRNAPDFDAPLQRAGGTNNAWTSPDATNYYDIVPDVNIDTALWLESDRLLWLTLGDDSIEAQRSVVTEEFKQRALNQPYGDMMHLLHGIAYTVHPYRWPTLGLSVDDIAAITRDDVVAFGRAHYAVNNAVMCVSGNIAFDEAVRRVEHWFGDIAPADVAARRVPREPRQTEPRQVTVTRDVPNRAIFRAYHMCGRTEADFAACDLLTDVLSNGRSSRFYRHLLSHNAALTGADACCTAYRQPGLIIISAKLDNGVSFEQAETLLDAELRRLITEPVTADELERYCNKARSTMLFETMSYRDKAVKLCQYEQLGRAEDINAEDERYRGVTTDDITRVAAEVFRPGNCSTVYYEPANATTQATGSTR